MLKKIIARLRSALSWVLTIVTLGIPYLIDWLDKVDKDSNDKDNYMGI